MMRRRWRGALACALMLPGCNSGPKPATTELTASGFETTGLDPTPASNSDSNQTDPTDATGPTGGSGGSGGSGEADTTAAPPTTGGGEQATIDCAALPGGLVGVDYIAEVSVAGGAPPYSWSAAGLPAGLDLIVDDPSSPIATIVGVPQVAGDFAVTLSVLDGDGLEAEAECGELTIGEPAKLDPDALLENFPDGCISFGVTVDDLEQMGVLAGGDGSPPTCSLVPGRGNGSQNFDLDLDTDDTFPPGIDVDPDTCELLGAINPTVSPGIHAWIVTLEQGGAAVHLPYCAAQKVQPPAAYDVEREDSGATATFVPGVVQLLPGSEQFSYGSDAPDPRLIVTDDVGACVGNTCFYSFIYTYNALSPVATVSANPNAKFPAQGFDGFTHASRISESDPALFAIFRDRPFVVNVQFEYCIADNGLDCGNNEADPNKRRELIRANGGGSRYAFSLIVLPG